MKIIANRVIIAEMDQKSENTQNKNKKNKSISHLARVLRPRKFADVIGQEIPSTLIQKALVNSMMLPVCTIFGPSGVGKTTLARLIAMWQCCEERTDEPCGLCGNCSAIIADAHPDVFELDGGTYTGVDDIKSMLGEIGYKTSMAKKRVYILDEVHMLSRHAMSSLLKKFEEELSGVQFILATTNVEKLPDTILSRSFQVRLDPVRDIKLYLRKVSDLLEYKIDDDSLECIEYVADGSVRQALSRLEQLAIMYDFEVTSENARKALGIAANASIDAILKTLEEGQLGELTTIAKQLGDVPPIGVLKQLVRKIRARMLEGKASKRLIEMGMELVEASLLVTKSEHALEICLANAYLRCL